MEQLLDTEIHQEPMTVAVVLYWLAESHMKARSLQERPPAGVTLGVA
jgi:hypothetical protein